MKNIYQICSRCVMDTSASDISFDKNGFCNFCSDFLSQNLQLCDSNMLEKDNDLSNIIKEIKKEGKGKKYDCVIGLSGGLDSSWALIQAIRLGLRPLAVHMDNGWNSELAQNNITNLVRGLGVDLYTHVIDWDEYRDLMQAFFDANVIDVELLYDNAMLAVNYHQAFKYNIKYILSGHNLATEGMRMPEKWNWFKYDKRNIKAIGKQFKNIRLKTFPAIGTFNHFWYDSILKIKWIRFLNYTNYNKFDALTELEKDFNFKPYPYKHYESIFTRFYQGYILPQKFGIDKRRIHYSTLIMTNQITREFATQELEGIPYPSKEDLEKDKIYFLKKMGWSSRDLDLYISKPEISHNSYPTENNLWEIYMLFLTFISNPMKYTIKALKKIYRYCFSKHNIKYKDGKGLFFKKS